MSRISFLAFFAAIIIIISMISVISMMMARVHNPTIAVSNVENFSHSTRLLAATTLRNVLGTKVIRIMMRMMVMIAMIIVRLMAFALFQNLAEILSERDTISHTMQVFSFSLRPQLGFIHPHIDLGS